MKSAETFCFGVEVADTVLARSRARWLPNADAEGAAVLEVTTTSSATAESPAAGVQSLTAYTAQGQVCAFSARYSDGKWTHYQIDAQGHRVLRSSFGEPVSVSGPAVSAVLEHNNIAALLLLMRTGASQLGPGETKAYAVLLPELNRTMQLPITRHTNDLRCEALGLRYMPPQYGRDESLQFTAEGVRLIPMPTEPLQGQAERQAQLTPDDMALASPPSIRFSDGANAHGNNVSPLTAVFTPAKGASRGWFVLVGGSGEYDALGYTRLGDNLGYRHWIEHMSARGLDVLSVGRTNDAAIGFDAYRQALLRLIDRHRAAKPQPLVLAGHSLGGLVAADIAPDLSGLSAVVLAACPARGLRKTILRQALAQTMKQPRRVQLRDRKALRERAQAFDRLIHGQEVSPASELRRGDRALIEHFALRQAPSLLRHWPEGVPLLIMHAEGDEKVDVHDADRWVTAAINRGLSVERLLLKGKDHVFGLMAPDADPSRLLNPVSDFLTRRASGLHSLHES